LLCATGLAGVEPRSIDAAELKADVKKLILRSVLYIRRTRMMKTQPSSPISRGRLFKTRVPFFDPETEGGRSASSRAKNSGHPNAELLAAREVTAPAVLLPRNRL
jgi:hypothetical protein